jgi:anti-sigma B factor antagonist
MPHRPQPFTVTTARHPGATVITMGGELEFASAPRLITHLNETFGEPAVRQVLDLGAVTFIDSAGLGALAHAARWAREHGLRVHLAGLCTQVREHLETSGMTGMFAVHPSLTAALAAPEAPPVGGPRPT